MKSKKKYIQNCNGKNIIKIDILQYKIFYSAKNGPRNL